MRRYKSNYPGRGPGLFGRIFQSVLRVSAYLLLPGACAAFLGGCGEQAISVDVNVIESTDEYDWQYTPAFVGEKDGDMQIDGVLSEQVWQDRNWLTHCEKDVSLRYTTAFTQKGLYIAAVAEDEHMQWNDKRAFMNNSSFRFYIVSNTAEDYFCFDCLNFLVDQEDSSCRQQVRFEAEAARSVNEAGVPTLTAEFFAAWEDLNYTVNPETGMPDFARIVPMYRYVEGFESADNAFLKPAFAEVDNNRVNNTLLFNKDGYINVSGDEAELGNAANGYAKSDGWDLSGLEGGQDGVRTVRTTAEHGQAIFFSDIESSRYAYSVDMKLAGGINDTAPSAGVCDMKSAAEFNCMRIAGAPYLDSGRKALTYNTLDFYETLWHDVLRGDRVESVGSDIINIRVIKDDTRYYYIINDVYAFSLDLDWLGGRTCPGLYSLGADVEYSGWETRDYEGAENDEAFAALTDEYMHVIKVSDRVSGGSLSLNKLAVRRGSGEAVELTVRPAKGYLLTDLLVNGKSEYDNLIPGMKDGVIELHPTESMMIDAVFTPLPAESCIRVTGQVARDNGAAVIGLPHVLQSSDADLTRLLSWQDMTTASGMFDVMLLRGGEYELGGRTFAADGCYTLSFEGTFPEGEQHVFTVDTGEERFEGQSFYDWGTIILNPVKARNMEQDSEGNVYTTNTDYSDDYSYFVCNEAVEGSFRLDMTARAENDRWPCYGFTLEDEYGGSVQFFAAGGTTYRIMRNYDGQYQQSDRGVTFAAGECRLALVCDENSDRIFFYVNDVLFDSVKRSDYLTGASVRYGIVGYMSGADGSFRRVTAGDPFAVFTRPVVTTEFSVTAPEEARLILNGERIDGKDVPVLSEVTVTIPVSGSRQYVIYLDGKPLETVREDGEIRAVFTVTGPHRIEYDAAYITEWIHDPFEYDSASGGYRVNDHMKTANGGYLAGASVKQGDPFLLEAVIRDMATSQWPSVGLLVGTDAEHYVRFSVIRNTDTKPNQYAFRVGNADGKEIVKWFSDIETLADNHPFKAGGSMKLGLAYEDGFYYVFINGNPAMAFDERELLSDEISIRDSLGGKNRVKLGLFAERRATFTSWSHSSDTDRYLAGTRGMEWIHRPLLYHEADGTYRVLDHGSVANGGYFKDAYIEQKGPFMLEATVRDMDTQLWPSVGLLVGTDAEHYVRFSVVRNTDAEPDVYGLRAGNAQGKEIVRWFSDIETLKDNMPFGSDGDGEMKLALVYDGRFYYMFVNGVMATAFGDYELLSGQISIRDSLGEGSVRPGLFAERKATFADWAYSGELSKYLGKVPKMEWIHTPLMYDFGSGRFRVTDRNSLANGGYFGNFSVKPGEAFLVEAGMSNMDPEFWPSAGVLVGTDAAHYVRFSVVRNTDADPDVYGLRVGNAGGKEIVRWFSDLEPLADNKPFGADEKGVMKLAVAYRDGDYHVFVNDELAVSLSENELLSGQVSIRDSLGSGNVKTGLFGERRITFTGWNYSADPSGYLKDMPRMEWIHSPMVYDFASGQYRVIDHNSVANGGYFTDFAGKKGESFLVEATVRDMDTQLWPSVGLLAGTDAEHYVRFSVVRNTDANPNVYGLRVGNADGKEIVKWFSDIETLADNQPFKNGGSMKLALAYEGGYYYLFVNGVQAAAFEGKELLSGEISIDASLGSGDRKVGLFAERRATFADWNYSADVSKYLGSAPKLEWIYQPLVFDAESGSLRVTDHNSTANGGYFADFSGQQGKAFLVKTTVRDMDADTWPSVGLLAGTDGEHYVRFSVIRNTDAAARARGGASDPYVYLLRVGNADGKELVRPFSDIPAFADHKPFGESGTGEMKLELLYCGGTYYVYINDVLAAGFAESVLLGNVDSGQMSIRDSLGSGSVKLGLFAERKITFVNWSYTADETEILNRLPSKEDQGSLKVSVTGVDTGAAVMVKDGSGNTVHSAQGGFTVSLSAGTYTVSAAGTGTVAKDETVVVTKGGTVEVTLKTLTKLEAATYTNQWGGQTAEFAFEPATGIYRGAYGLFNTGVLAQPVSVSASDSWVLEGDVQIIADWQYPSVGFALYNGSDFAQNVKFEIVRVTADENNKDGHERLVRVNGKNYIQGQPGDAGAEHSDWVAANQEALKGRVHMALVHADSGYYLFLNGSPVCGIMGQEAQNLTSGWGSIRPGFYAEQEATFENWGYSADISGYEDQLPGTETGSLKVSVTGVDTGAAVTVKDGSGNTVHSAHGGFTVSLSAGTYTVSAAGTGTVAKDETVVVTKGGTVEVTLKTLTKLEAATYTNQWGGQTAEFAFEPATGIYRGAYGLFNTGVLAQPVSVSASDSWVLEGDVQIIADWQYPSVGFALYNGSDFAQNVKFEIVRVTADENNKDGHERLVRVNGKNYIQGQPGDAGAEHSDWVAANQEALKGRVHMALVHADSGYYLFLNGSPVCGIMGQEAQNLTSGWGSIRPGFYAEQEATFENWGYSADISGYQDKLPPKMEWIHDPFVYDFAAGQYLVTDHNKTANGGWFAGFSQSQGAPFLAEATVRDMDTQLWPSAGLLVGTDASHYVRFSVIRNTDANPNVYALRVGNAVGQEIVKWFADLDGLQDNLPFGADGTGSMKLAVAYQDGSWHVFINDRQAVTLAETELLSGATSIRDSLGTGDLKAGLFAERMVTFVNWNYSGDLGGYADQISTIADAKAARKAVRIPGRFPSEADGTVSGNDAGTQETVSGNDAGASEAVSGNDAGVSEVVSGNDAGGQNGLPGSTAGAVSGNAVSKGTPGETPEKNSARPEAQGTVSGNP